MPKQFSVIKLPDIEVFKVSVTTTYEDTPQVDYVNLGEMGLAGIQSRIDRAQDSVSTWTSVKEIAEGLLAQSQPQE